MTEIEASGQSVPDAIEQGLGELGVSEDEVEVEVLAEDPARVKLRLRKDSGETPNQDGQVAEEPPDYAEILEDGREDALDFLEGLLDSMDLDGSVDVEVQDDTLRATVAGEELGVLIGRHGRTLEALQELLRAAVQHQGGARIRISLDIEGYRERRREALTEMAHDVADRALQVGEARLEPMSAFERKVVHDAVGEIDGVTSQSEGEEPRRYVVIRRTDEQPAPEEEPMPEEEPTPEEAPEEQQPPSD
jgi:spoIIIJ-associated protein